MEIKILSAQWGLEPLEYRLFLDKIRLAGYDGFDVWIPEGMVEKRMLFDYVQRHELYLVTHQYRAEGHTFNQFKSSYLKNLHQCAEPGPLLINSHTGRDYFSIDQNLALLDMAQEFSEKTGITVAHETHRGRLGYSPQMMAMVFALREGVQITADFSHWTCVTESMLENFDTVVTNAIVRSAHVHARVGHEEGPQVADPRAPEWDYALQRFLSWWDRIVQARRRDGTKVLAFTTEFGPPPYMPTAPFTGHPLANQFEVNCYMKDLLRKRYAKVL